MKGNSSSWFSPLCRLVIFRRAAIARRASRSSLLPVAAAQGAHRQRRAARRELRSRASGNAAGATRFARRRRGSVGGRAIFRRPDRRVFRIRP
jgi:hypothetical protein